MTATTPIQQTSRTPRLALSRSTVRRLLALDAAACAALGVAGAAGAGLLDERLGVPSVVLVIAGVALLAYAAGAAAVARRPSRQGLVCLVLANVGFAAGSAAVVVAADVTALGMVVGGALVVVSLVVADLLLLGLRGDVAPA
jgi:hypothetical protein